MGRRKLSGAAGPRGKRTAARNRSGAFYANRAVHGGRPLGSRSAEAEVIKNLPTKSGMAVNELSEAERQRIRKVLQPVVDKYSKDYDPALLAEFWAEVEKARKATAK